MTRSACCRPARSDDSASGVPNPVHSIWTTRRQAHACSPTDGFTRAMTACWIREVFCTCLAGRTMSSNVAGVRINLQAIDNVLLALPRH